MTVNRRLGSPNTRSATAPSTARGSATTQTGRPVASASPRPAGSVRTATAPAAAASAAYRTPCVRLPGSAAYRSPGRTSPEARVTPRTSGPPPPGSPTAGPTRSASSARRSGRCSAGGGADPRSFGVTGLQSTGGGRRSRAAARPRHPGAPGVAGSGPGEAELRPRLARRDHAAGRERVSHDVGEHRRGHLTALGVARGPLEVDGDDVLRVVGRREPHERGHVPAAGVAAALGIGPLGGTGLPGDPEPLDLAERRRAP